MRKRNHQFHSSAIELPESICKKPIWLLKRLPDKFLKLSLKLSSPVTLQSCCVRICPLCCLYVFLCCVSSSMEERLCRILEVKLKINQSINLQGSKKPLANTLWNTVQPIQFRENGFSIM